jgi:hypothetical protein
VSYSQESPVYSSTTQYILRLNEFVCSSPGAIFRKNHKPESSLKLNCLVVTDVHNLDPIRYSTILVLETRYCAILITSLGDMMLETRSGWRRAEIGIVQRLVCNWYSYTVRSRFRTALGVWKIKADDIEKRSYMYKQFEMSHFPHFHRPHQMVTWNSQYGQSNVSVFVYAYKTSRF